MEQPVKYYRNPDEPISLEDLKSFLWGAATRLRGQIDAAGYKEYIFPLLFFKRISDVYDEQFEGYVCEGGIEYANAQAQELVIRIPDGAHWRDVRECTENVGQRLVEAFIAIEQANPGEHADGRVIGGLEGIFGPKDGWTNKAKMPDHIITSLIEDFSRYNLSLKACPADEMGQAYEYLVGKFADDAGNTAQEFYTNRTVVDLMAEILQPRPDESIYDPTCGSGGMLVKCLDFLRKKGEPWQGVKVFGQEINALTSAIARMNLYLNGVEDFSIAKGDTLETPMFFDGSKIRSFDIVLANPPYSIKQWNRDAFMNDKWGRNMWGAPIQARADYAFIQHIISSMDKETGRSATLLPHGVLNREEDKEIRKKHVESDTIDAIIGLGRNLFYNSGLESFIFICSNCKPKNRKGKILFIEAEKCTHKSGKQAYLFPEDINRIVEAYRSDEDIPGFSKHVSTEDVLLNEGNLNIKSYVKSIDSQESLTLEDSLDKYIESQNILSDTLSELCFVDSEMPKLSSPNLMYKESNHWARVRLSDVAEEYSVRIDNPSLSEYDFYIGSDCIGQYDFRIHKRSDASTITSAQKLFKEGDYLLVRRSLYGSDFRERAPRADFDGVCSADILTIREKKGVIADGFLIYVLYQKSLWDFIVSNSNGGLTRRIKWKQLADYEFDLPPIEEQRILADKLWAAYRLKESYKKLLTATQEMVKSQFIEMYKDLLVNGKIEDLVDRKIASVKKSYHDSDEIEYIDISSIDNISNTIVETTKYEVSNAPSRAQQCVKKGDILVSTVRPINRNIAVVTRGLQNLVASTGFCVLRPKEEYREYLLSIVKSDAYTEHMCDKASGGLYPAVNNGDVFSYGIHIPNKELAQKVSTIHHQADKSEFELRKSIEAIDQVIKSLINDIK
jgi:type I restriction enzyme M protein